VHDDWWHTFVIEHLRHFWFAGEEEQGARTVSAPAPRVHRLSPAVVPRAGVHLVVVAATALGRVHPARGEQPLRWSLLFLLLTVRAVGKGRGATDQRTTSELLLVACRVLAHRCFGALANVRTS
jgi:hypothetical protein